MNAADAMRTSGAITITTRTDSADGSPRAVRIEIADTGVGIAPELVSRVFDAGFTTKTGGQPHGFGLGICRRIAQMHGGQIDLSSVPGRGTTVSLTLPVHSEVSQETFSAAACTP